MSYHYYQAYPQQNYQGSVTDSGLTMQNFIPGTVLALGTVGAVVGAAGSAAKNIRQIKQGETSNEEAAKDVLKEAAGTGLATAAGAAVANAFGSRGLLSLAGMLAVATGTKYLWNTATSSGAPAEKQKASAKLHTK